MADVTIYHNQKWGKSRGALDILRDRNVEFDVINYIETPPSEKDIRKFLELLPNEPKELIHPGPFGDLGKNIDDFNTPDALVGLLLEHPEVMNRPICIHGDRAIIARPAELVNEILDWDNLTETSKSPSDKRLSGGLFGVISFCAINYRSTIYYQYYLVFINNI